MNRAIIFLSGFLRCLLLSFYILGLTADKSYDVYVLISGVVLILFICIPMSLFERYRQNRKIDGIIRSHKIRVCKRSDTAPKKAGR
jgi:hypothetical protein